MAAKRDFYNLRSPRPKTLDAFVELLTEAERAPIKAMLSALEDIAAAEAAAQAAYRDETQFVFGELTKRFSSHGLRDALQRSNPFLVEKLDGLTAGKAISARDSVSLNMALFAYFHRAALKTSPRSSLTLVAPGRWTELRSGQSDALALSSLQVERSIAARHGLIEWLFQPLLQDQAALGPDARIAINPTARVAGDHLEWRRVLKTEPAGQEISGITETTSRVKMNRGLALLLQLFENSGAERMTLSALTDGLKRQLPEGAWPGLPRLLGAALSQGIIDALPAVPDQVDKLVWAKHALSQLGDEPAARLRDPLQRFEAAVDACRMAPDGDSIPAYRRLEESFGALTEAAGSPLPVESVRPIVHEDCKVTAPSLCLHPDELGRAREDLPGLLQLLPLLRGYGWPQFWLASRFLDQFGPNGRCDDPEAFLLEAAHKLETPGEPSNVATRVQLGAPPPHPVAVAADAVAQSFLAAATALNKDAPERRIPNDLVSEHYAALPEALRRRSRSHCLNAQLLCGSGDDRLMINAVYAGNSRIMSRFIADDPAQQAETRAYLGRLAGGKYAAIPGVFGFNVNLHPPFADIEVGLPLRREDFGDSSIVPLADLGIVYDEREARIVLVNAKGERIEPFYFGTLNPRGLPAVHRMLDWMSGAADNLLSIAGGLASPAAEGTAPEVAVHRRTTMGRLVLTRSAQVAPIGLLPDSQIDEYAFFAEFQSFCSRWSIPRETFFRIHGGEVVDSGNEAKRQRAPKWRKPMHLDAHNPVAVRTLQRALRRHEGVVEFAEALPAPDSARVTVDGAKRVSELTFEIGLTGY
ncbi:MAG TPA: lantibiotic dehydratase [Allosphingosinicella sp.]